MIKNSHIVLCFCRKLRLLFALILLFLAGFVFIAKYTPLSKKYLFDGFFIDVFVVWLVFNLFQYGLVNH